jgi:hypothetical protein
MDGRRPSPATGAVHNVKSVQTRISRGSARRTMDRVGGTGASIEVNPSSRPWVQSHPSLRGEADSSEGPSPCQDRFPLLRRAEMRTRPTRTSEYRTPRPGRLRPSPGNSISHPSVVSVRPRSVREDCTELAVGGGVIRQAIQRRNPVSSWKPGPLGSPTGTTFRPYFVTMRRRPAAPGHQRSRVGSPIRTVRTSKTCCSGRSRDRSGRR